MKKLISAAAVFSLVFSSFAVADIVARYDFEDGSITSSDADPNSTAGIFIPSAGLTYASSTVGDNQATPFTTSAATGDVNGSPDSNLIGGADQSTQAGALTNNDYLSFTLTPTAGFSYTFTQLDFKLAASGANFADGFFVRTNLTGSINIASGTFTSVQSSDGAFDLFTVNLSGIAELQNVSSAVEFRFYLYNPDAGSTSDSVRIDKIFLQADVIPEPATWTMFGLGAVLLVGVQRLRRKRR